MTLLLKLQICDVNIGICLLCAARSAFWAHVYQVSVKLRSTTRSLSGVTHLWLSHVGSASEAADVCKVPFRREATAAEAAADPASLTRVVQQQAQRSAG